MSVKRRDVGNTEILTRRTRDFNKWFDAFEKFVEQERLFEGRTPVENTNTFLMYVDVDMGEILKVLCEDKSIFSTPYPELKKLLIDHINAINGRV